MAAQVQNDLYDSRLDCSRETTLPRQDPGEAAGAAAGDANHPFDRRAGPLRGGIGSGGIGSHVGPVSPSAVLLGEERQAYGAPRLASQATPGHPG